MRQVSPMRDQRCPPARHVGRYRGARAGCAIAGLLIIGVVWNIGSSSTLAQQDCSDIPIFNPPHVAFQQRIIYYDFQFAANTAIPKGARESIIRGFEEATRALSQGTQFSFRLAVTDAQKADA